MSALVKKTAPIGLLRGESRCGCNSSMFSIWRGRSGDALIKNHGRLSSDSLLMAMLDCVCGAILPARAAAQFAQAQFHCGKPPPAALPRMWMRINPKFSQ